MLRACLAFSVLVALGLAGYFMAGGQAQSLLHPFPVFVVLVTLPVILAVLIAFPTPLIREALHSSRSCKPGSNVEKVWDLAEKLSYLAGIAASLLGLLITFRYLDQGLGPFGAKVGASLMGALLGILQGAFFRILKVTSKGG